MKKDRCERTSCEDRQPLASEIIAEQKREIEELKKKLAEAKEDRNLFYQQRNVLMLQLDIFNFALMIEDAEALRVTLDLLKYFYEQQTEKDQGDEVDGEM